MLRRSLIVIALCGCGSKKDAPKQEPVAAVVVDAAPDPAGLHVVAADATVTLPVRSSVVVVIATDGAVTYASQPVGDEVALASLPTGAPVAIAALASTLKPLAAPADPCPGILGNVRSPDVIDGEAPLDRDGYGYFAPQGGGVDWSDLTGSRTPAGLRGQVLGSYCDVGAPLVIADARATAATLIEVLDALDRATLAVTTDGGKHARMLAIEMTYRKGNTPAGDDAIELGFTLRPDEVRGAAYRGRVADEQAWMWRGDVTNLADGYHQGAATTALLGAQQARLRIDGNVTAGALITAIASLVAGHAVTVAIGEPIDFEDQGHGAGFGNGGTGTVTHPASKATLGEPQITGAFDKNLLRRYLKRNLPKITYCYEKLLPADPLLAGTVTVTFTIEPSGTITGATGRGVSREVATCAAAVIQSISLPKPEDGVANEVTQTIELKPVAQP